ncbi:PREDICTED: GDSL esterase/lipase At4g16230-like isoform X1 [Tarenaya hassleriana]|nr:PREDICTED: GDSL esterase/lipase At4g16230-like isoform X1 [Tarenaya hassleriana]
MEAAKLLEKALFSVTIGSNDLINNYFTPVVSSFERKLVPPPVFVDAMISRLRSQLTRLYEMGGRKIVVTNVGPVGCIPFEREVDLTAGVDRCAAQPNLMARMYNLRLRSLVEELNSNLRGATFVYADVFHIVYDILENYASYGFASERTPCCGIAAGKVGGLIPCGPSSTICTDRSKYVFWDPYHPSDSANLIIARRLLSGSSDDVFPFNIRQLVDL